MRQNTNWYYQKKIFVNIFFMLNTVDTGRCKGRTEVRMYRDYISAFIQTIIIGCPITLLSDQLIGRNYQ